jgi:serine/threonine-protein kinase
LDHRSDIWSFCVMLYEALSDRLPYEALSYDPELAPAGQALLKPLPIDEGLWTILARGLCTDREQRWASMAELGRALAGWLVEHQVGNDITGVSLDTRWAVPPPSSSEADLRARISRCPTLPSSGVEVPQAEAESVTSIGKRQGRKTVRTAMILVPVAAAGVLIGAQRLGMAPGLFSAVSQQWEQRSTQAMNAVNERWAWFEHERQLPLDEKPAEPVFAAPAVAGQAVCPPAPPASAPAPAGSSEPYTPPKPSVTMPPSRAAEKRVYQLPAVPRLVRNGSLWPESPLSESTEGSRNALPLASDQRGTLVATSGTERADSTIIRKFPGDAGAGPALQPELMRPYQDEVANRVWTRGEHGPD